VMRMHKPGTCRALIVCPLSIMQRVWSDAVFKNFLGARTVEILHGDATARSKALARPADLYICNFDGVGVGAHTRKKFELDGFSKELAARDDIRICIVDEASAYKDSTTKRHRIARQVFGKKDYLWLLTGTPTPTAPTDAYGLAKLVNNANGQSFQSFKMSSMYQLAPNSFKWLPRRDGYEKARALLKPSIRFSIDQVWDAPPITTQVREVELTAEQKKLMSDLKKDFVVTVKSGAAISAVNEAAARIKFIQISLGAIYDQNHGIHAIDAGPRHAEIIDVLEQAPGKSILFCPLTSVINIIYKNINKRWPAAVVNGDVSQKDRSNIFQAFQDLENPLRVLVADAQTMAHGLDLYAARVVVWVGPTDKPELYAQANARMHRPGQKFPTTVVQLVSNALEREIFRRLENNLALQGTLLQAVKENWI
jgi:SNF2 family DNA or RNA helicase